MRSDEQLVDAVLSGQRDAFALLVQRYERSARAEATHVLDDIHAAEDAAQDGFVVAYQRLATLRKRGAFGSWLLTIVRHEAIRIARQRARQQALQLSRQNAPASHNGRLDCSAPSARTTVSKRRMTIELGEGEGSLRVVTHNGGVSVR